MVLFCFIFYTLVTALFLILCIGEHKADAKVVYAAIAIAAAAAQFSIGIR
jgi:hypothetical protein